MPAPTEITAPQLARLIGTPDAPVIIDVRIDEDFDTNPRLIPGASRQPYKDVVSSAGAYTGQKVVIVCHHGKKLSMGVAAHLRAAGAVAETLMGGAVAWAEAGMPMVDGAALGPTRGSLWVTRHRPKIDRIACPWLIRRFVDAAATFLFVAPGEVEAVAERFDATPFDIEGVDWSHRGDLCTFQVMLDRFGLEGHAPLVHLGRIVCAADTDRLADEPQAAGLLAVSLGLSRMHRDDLAQLEAAMPVYDALYRWCRDATGETHDWPTPGGAR